MPPMQRIAWEYQAVLRGRAWPVLDDGPIELPPYRRLWIFPPNTGHGWTGPPGCDCEVAVMHFDEAPPPLKQLTACRGYHSVELTAAEARRLRDWTAELQPHLNHPTDRSLLYFQRVYAEVSLIALKGSPTRPLTDGDGYAVAKVDQALTWYRENLSFGPTVADVAGACHVSVSHMRRLFQRARGCSPLAAMREIQLRRARELIEQRTLTMSQIAEACGFSGQTVFSRAFRGAVGLSPSRWLERVQRGRTSVAR